MTVKDGLHALTDHLAEDKARDALDYPRALAEPPSRPSREFIEANRRAREKALASNAVLVPQEAVHAWRRTRGTPEEEAAEAESNAPVVRLRRQAQDTPSK